MLVLSRKEGEKVIIDGGITVEVIEVRGKVIRLGFTAPGNVNIWREEVFERMLKTLDVEKATEEELPRW